uniref:Putative WW-binding domain-containing protein n=1 Tax=Cyprinodon variegatus TaxID=28743 RepID=A0A3Q2CCY1_CYPVA
MAKRRAEEPLLLDSPIKRRHLAPLCCVGMQPESMASAGGVSSPSILTLLGSRCRKRPHYSDNEASDLFPKVSLWDSGKFALDTDKDSSEDDTYNSFQYWRVPLPELDLSLLEHTSDQSQMKDKSKDNTTSADAMES